MNYKTFSLVLATIGRKNEIQEFLESIEKSNYPLQNIEIILIDQNKDDFLQKIIKNYTKKIKIIYIKSLEKGLSKNRNIGLKYISNEIIGFPDDDCKYFDDTLLNVSKSFEFNPSIDGIIGRIIDEDGNDCIRKWSKKKMKITKNNFYTKASSITIFEKNKKFLQFDEELGAGAKYGSSEDADFLYRTLKSGKKINYNPDIIIYHPKPNNTFSKEKAYSYGIGHGVFVKKNFDLNILLFFIQGLILVNFRIIIGLLTCDFIKVIIWYFSLKGRIKGIVRK
ncbi:MAG: glycosyltransferase [Fusobacteriaceae bacterium]